MTAFTRLYMHLEVAGTGAPIAGEAADLDFMRKIVLSGMNWTIKRSDEETRSARGPARGSARATATAGTGGSSSSASSRVRAEPEVLEISKPMDKASTQMLTQLTAGNKLNVIVSLAGALESSFLLTITLTNARITEFKLNVKDGEKAGEVEEDWTFNYDTISFAYKTEAAPGGTAKTLSSSHKRDAGDSTEKSSTGVEKVMTAYKDLSSESDKRQAATDLRKAFEKDKL